MGPTKRAEGGVAIVRWAARSAQMPESKIPAILLGSCYFADKNHSESCFHAVLG